MIHNKKRIIAGTACTAAFLLIMSACVGVMKTANGTPTAKAAVGKYIVTETETVPVTTPDGESVTNESGEQVFDVVTVTQVREITTQKQSFINKIFGSSEEKSDSAQANDGKNTGKGDEKKSLFSFGAETEKDPGESGTSSNSGLQKTETTEKQSFWYKLFGKDDETETPPHTSESESVSSENVQNTQNFAVTGVYTTLEQTTKQQTTAPTKADTTKPQTTLKPTTTQQTTIDNTAQQSKFKYTEINGKIKLTEYIGNAAEVIVPAEVDGKSVAYLGEGLFVNSSYVKTITFLSKTSGNDKFYLPHDTAVFKNLSALTSVTFPYETNPYFIKSDGTEVKNEYTFDKLFTNCPKIKEVNFGERQTGFSQMSYRMHSHDGVVCSYTDSNTKCKLVWYPRAKTTANYTLPSEVYSVYKDAVRDNPYLESVTVTDKCTEIGATSFWNCPNLKSFSVSSGQTKFSVYNGVLFYPNTKINGVQRYSFIYPCGKKESYFEIPEKYPLYVSSTAFRGNPYVTTVKMPSVTRLDGDFVGEDPPSLKKLVLPKKVDYYNKPTDYYEVEYY